MKRGFEIDSETINVHGDVLDLKMEWKSLRVKLTSALKMTEWGRLAIRRPTVFEGLQGCQIDTKMHRKFLSSLPHYEMVLLVRIWSGCALTKAHKHTIRHEEDPLL